MLELVGSCPGALAVTLTARVCLLLAVMLRPRGGTSSGVVTFAYPVFGVGGHLEFFIVHLE